MMTTQGEERRRGGRGEEERRRREEEGGGERGIGISCDGARGVAHSPIVYVHPVLCTSLSPTLRCLSTPLILFIIVASLLSLSPLFPLPLAATRYPPGTWYHLYSRLYSLATPPPLSPLLPLSRPVAAAGLLVGQPDLDATCCTVPPPTPTPAATQPAIASAPARRQLHTPLVIGQRL